MTTTPQPAIRPTAARPAVDSTVPTPTAAPTRRSVVAEQKGRHGGVKWGSAFFGSLTTLGAAALLGIVAAAVGSAAGLTTALDGLGATVDQVGAGLPAPAVGVAGAVAVLVVILVAFSCGGYVAGRMARFSGAWQGVAVWVWSIVLVVALGALGATISGRLGTLPRISLVDTGLSTTGVIATLVGLGVALLGAVLGGMAGMRFHRRVDRTGLDG